MADDALQFGVRQLAALLIRTALGEFDGGRHLHEGEVDVEEIITAAAGFGVTLDLKDFQK